MGCSRIFGSASSEAPNGVVRLGGLRIVGCEIPRDGSARVVLGPLGSDVPNGARHRVRGPGKCGRPRGRVGYPGPRRVRRSMRRLGSRVLGRSCPTPVRTWVRVRRPGSGAEGPARRARRVGRARPHRARRRLVDGAPGGGAPPTRPVAGGDRPVGGGVSVAAGLGPVGRPVAGGAPGVAVERAGRCVPGRPAPGAVVGGDAADAGGAGGGVADPGARRAAGAGGRGVAARRVRGRRGAAGGAGATARRAPLRPGGRPLDAGGRRRRRRRGSDAAPPATGGARSSDCSTGASTCGR